MIFKILFHKQDNTSFKGTQGKLCKMKLTDSSGNITWSIGVEKTSRKESAVSDKTTLMFSASKIKGKILSLIFD